MLEKRRVGEVYHGTSKAEVIATIEQARKKIVAFRHPLPGEQFLTAPVGAGIEYCDAYHTRRFEGAMQRGEFWPRLILTDIP